MQPRTIASQIIDIAARRGLSSADLAELTGQEHHSYWSKVLAGKREPGPKAAQRAADALGEELIACQVYTPAARAGDKNCHSTRNQVTKIVTARKSAKPLDDGAKPWRRVQAGDSPNAQPGWLSADGQFFIWVQARPRDEPPYYAASRVINGHTPGRAWLGSMFTLQGAKAACGQAASR